VLFLFLLQNVPAHQATKTHYAFIFKNCFYPENNFKLYFHFQKAGKSIAFKILKKVKNTAQTRTYLIFQIFFDTFFQKQKVFWSDF